MKNTKKNNTCKTNKTQRTNRLRDSIEKVIHPRYIEIGARIRFFKTKTAKMLASYDWDIVDIRSGRCEIVRVSKRDDIYHVGEPIMVDTQLIMRKSRLVKRSTVKTNI